MKEPLQSRQSPCYDPETKTDCPRRCVGCRKTCTEWADFEARKDELYRERLARHQLGSDFAGIKKRFSKETFKRRRK